MKRVTSLLFGALAAMLLVAPAQAQLVARKSLVKSKGALVRPVDSALMRAMKEKATSEKNVASHALATLRNSVKPVMADFTAAAAATPIGSVSVRDLSNDRTPLRAGQQKAGEVVDAHGIITSPAEGVTKFYTRQGSAYYVSGSSVYGPVEQTGRVEIVECEDGTVYVKDFISRYPQGTWVKGTKAGNTLTFACGQPLSYNSNYNATVDLYWWSYNEETGNFEAVEKADVTFTIDGDVFTMQDSNENLFVSGTWSDDQTFAGPGDFETVWTLDADYEPTPTDLVELPEGLVPEEWTVSGVLTGQDKLKGEVNVAVADDAIYVQGLFAEDFPEAWIKGTINGNEVTFSALQYLGKYGSYDIWAVGSEDGKAISDYVMNYDKEAGTLTAVTQLLVANAADDRIYALDYIAELMLQADMSAGPIIATGDPVDELPYVNSFDTAEEQAAFGIYNANGDLDSYGDELTWTFTEEGEAYNKYSKDEAADEWLFSPAIKLEAGKTYPFSIIAYASSTSFPERLEVKLGTTARTSAMKTQVIAPTLIDWTSPQALEATFTVEKSGYYHFGVHAISDADMWYLYADDFTVGAALDPAAPAAPRVIVKADPYGLPKAVVTVMAPQYSISGQALDALSRIDVFCDGELVKTFDQVEPAGSYIFSEQTTQGTHSYRAVAYVGEVEGLKSPITSTLIGIDEPGYATITNVMTRPGAVTVEWDPITEGYSGGIVVPSDIKYSIWSTTTELIWGIFETTVPDEKLVDADGNSATVEMETEEGEQRWESLMLVAENEVGESDTEVQVCVGAPYELPFEESFANGEPAHYWAINYTTTAEVGLLEDAYDEDGGALDFAGAAGDFAQAYVGKVKIEGQNPVLTFQAKGDAGSKVNVRVQKTDGKMELVKSVATTEEYSMVNVSMKDYVAEPYVKLIIEGNFSAEGLVCVDDIRLFNQQEYDLAIAISAPAKVAAGKAAPVKLTVLNNGSKTARNYSVAVKAGSNVIFDQPYTALQPLQAQEIEVEYNTSMFSNATSVSFVALVRFEDDLAPENNTANATTAIEHSTAKQPTGVKATKGSESITVTWDAVAAGATETVTEDFSAYENEQYENLGDWTLINANNAPKGGIFEGYQFAFQGTTAAFAVFKPSVYEAIGLEDASPYYGPSGDPNEAYLTSFYNSGDAGYMDNDDWLISPTLSGNAQTVKFFVGSPYVGYGPATYEVLYSTTDQQISSFTKIAEGAIEVEGWEEVSVALPAGATYFAIRNISDSESAFMFSVANITFEKGSVSVTKFNIWASIAGEWTLVDDVPGTASSAELKGAEVMKATAVAVSAVYNNGQESKPVIVRFGLGNQEITAITELMATGKSVDVYSLDGKLIRSQANSLEGLKGAYVIEGRKVILK